MSLRGIFSAFREHDGYRKLAVKLAEHRCATVYTNTGGRPLLLASLWQDVKRTMLVLTPGPEEARSIYDQLHTYAGNHAPIYLLPEPDLLPFERITIDSYTNNQRLMAIDALCNKPETHPPLIVASLAGIIRKTISKPNFMNSTHTLTVGQDIRLGELTHRWIKMGYRKESSVEIPGTFSQRGGIVDVFSPNSDMPTRIDMLGNEIEAIYSFNPSTQRSVESIRSFRIVPAQETLPMYTNKERISYLVSQMDLSSCAPAEHDLIQDDLTNLFTIGGQGNELLYSGLINESSLFEYLDNDALTVFDGFKEIEDAAKNLESQTKKLQQARVARGDLPNNFPSPFFTWAELSNFLNRCTILDIGSINTYEEEFGFRTPPLFYGHMTQFISFVQRTLREKNMVIVVTRRPYRIAEILSEADVGASVVNHIDDLTQHPTVLIVDGYLSQGWALAMGKIQITLFTDLELFGVVKQPTIRRKRPVKHSLFLSQLEPGCYVVHEDHGIARFAGTKTIGISGEQREYLVLEYAQSDKLYLPTDHLDRITSYVAINNISPTLTRLSSADWVRAKNRVKDSTQKLAKELLDLYAGRHVVRGRSFSPDSIWQRELEDAFPHEETVDQVRTIEEVKHDMESTSPMDRLICGDVGYGKTEVALRAAFKSVNDGLQVAILVPTTILAQQHHVNFTDRLRSYPLRVEVLSRLRSAKDQKKILEDLKAGSIDIIIGTHRIIQNDVEFHDLGLVIVDEEQRFGVIHKERLKKLRKDVDTLSLSATPIPRTLYMALSGIRDMSTMETPPEERLPIKTYVGEYSDHVVKEAILRELDRGGQVFFLHNRIKSINRTADHLARLIPRARIAIAHGRMTEESLEDVMLSFNQGESNVLVCTTIIESGLDIPTANTLIVDRADRLGLSQLYQLRGRVGRSSNRAYSYLLIPKGQQITQEANHRLRAILEASELGAGFRIAMRDLEIRGAGNILGSEQSGNIHSVGFQLYSKLLNQAIEDIRNQNQDSVRNNVNEIDTRVDLPMTAHIPQDYISHLPNRLAIYQRFMNIKRPDQLMDIKVELRDRFGQLPQTVENLLYIISIKLLVKGMDIKSITTYGNNVLLTLNKSVGGAKLALEKALGKSASVGNRQIRLNRNVLGTDWQNGLVDILKSFKEFTKRMGDISESSTEHGP